MICFVLGGGLELKAENVWSADHNHTPGLLIAGLLELSVPRVLGGARNSECFRLVVGQSLPRMLGRVGVGMLGGENV